MLADERALCRAPPCFWCAASHHPLALPAVRHIFPSMAQQYDAGGDNREDMGQPALPNRNVSFATAQVGPVTATTSSESNSVHFRDIFKPGGMKALAELPGYNSDQYEDVPVGFGVGAGACAGPERIAISQVGPVMASTSSESGRVSGEVSVWFPERGFGFVKITTKPYSNGSEAFVHWSDLMGFSEKAPYAGERVTLTLLYSPMTQEPYGVRVRRAES